MIFIEIKTLTGTCNCLPYRLKTCNVPSVGSLNVRKGICTFVVLV